MSFINCADDVEDIFTEINLELVRLMNEKWQINDLTYSRYARRLGLSQATVRAIYCNRATLNVSSIVGIADKLGKKVRIVFEDK